MEKLTKNEKLNILEIALKKVTANPLWGICELLRILTEEETGKKLYTAEIQETFKLNQFRPEGHVGMDNWWGRDSEGQTKRIECLNLLINDLNN